MYPPSAALRAAGIDPQVVADLLDPDHADVVPLRPAPRWMRLLWGDVGAMTLPWAIYVHPDLLTGDPGRLGAVVVHELVHVAQWRRQGVVRFLAGYLAAYLRARSRGSDHRTAYEAIPAEQEARTVTARILGGGPEVR